MAKKRVKSDDALITIDSWEYVDGYVRNIGDLVMKITDAEHAAKDKIDEARVELAGEVKPLAEKINRYTRSIEAFAVTHKADFKNKRSRQLNFGVLGWRKSTSVSIKKNTLELIKKVFSRAKAKACIRVKETVDKDALAKFTDEQLVEVGARRKEKDVFYVEPDLPEAVDYVR